MQRNVAVPSLAVGGGSSLHTYLRHRASPQPVASLSKDLSVLAALESRSKTASDGASSTESGWSSWEVLASMMLAVAATGGFLTMGSATMTSPSFSPKIIHRGGGGSGGGGPSGSPAPLGEKKEEKNQVVSVLDEHGREGESYQVSRAILRIFLNAYGIQDDSDVKMFFSC